MTNQLVPSLRFKQFRDQWNEYKITDLSQYKINGGTPSTKIDKYWHGSIPWIRSSDLNDNDLLNAYPERYVNTETIKETSTKLIPNNSIAIVTRVGVGKLAYIKYNYSTSQDFLSLSNLRFNPYFLVYDLYLLINKEKQKLQGTSIKGITKDYLLSRKTFIPNQSEEQQIGDFFTKLDHMIELQTKKLSHLRELKKGYLQKMFPQKGESVPQLRFNGFYDDWKSIKIKNISDVKTGKSHYRKKTVNKYYPILGSTNIIGYDSSYDYEGKFLLIARVGEAGQVYKYNGQVKITDNTIYLKYSRDSFLLEALKAKRLYRWAIGSGRKLVKSSEIKNILIKIPSNKEQEKLNTFIVNANKIIYNQKSRVNDLKKLKKAYLQKMFI